MCYAPLTTHHSRDDMRVMLILSNNARVMHMQVSWSPEKETIAACLGCGDIAFWDFRTVFPSHQLLTQPSAWWSLQHIYFGILSCFYCWHRIPSGPMLKERMRVLALGPLFAVQLLISNRRLSYVRLGQAMARYGKVTPTSAFSQYVVGYLLLLCFPSQAYVHL
jgi:hypothetical protein